MSEINKHSGIKLLKIRDILSRESDETHPITTNRLIAFLAKSGIRVTRKTLYADIATLNEFGFEIMCKRSQSNEYYVAERAFSVPELHILIDSLQAATFIPKEQTKELVDKVASLGGCNKGEVVKKNIVRFNTVKSSNKHIFYSLNEMLGAIEKNKKISFLYFNYNFRHERVYKNEGKEYVVSPLATVLADDYYYLFCYSERHEGVVSHFRIDRMDKVSVCEEERYFPPELSLDVEEQYKQLFGMFSGKTETVTFCVDEILLGAMFDKFGADTSVCEDGEKFTFSAKVQTSDLFYGWCSSFGNKLKILSPKAVVDEFKRYIECLMKGYKETK